MEGTPALVPTEQPTNVAYERRIARGPHQVPKRRRRNRLPARQNGPDGKAGQADRSDRSERHAERGAVRARRKQDVRREQDDASDRNAAVPYGSAVDPIEPLLHPRQGADQHETDRKQENRLGAQELPEVTASGRSSRTADEPQSAHGDDQGPDERWPNLPGDEAMAH